MTGWLVHCRLIPDAEQTSESWWEVVHIPPKGWHALGHITDPAAVVEFAVARTRLVVRTVSGFGLLCQLGLELVHLEHLQMVSKPTVQQRELICGLRDRNLR